MELNYQVGDAPKDLKRLQPIYDAHNKLMANIQLCGTFSDKLIERVYSLSWNVLCTRERIEYEKGEIGNDGAHAFVDKSFDDFKWLFEAYNIFSKEFKGILLDLFSTICYYDGGDEM